MVGITSQLIEGSPQLTNCLNERTIDFRGKNITALDEKALTLLGDQFDEIIFIENDLTRLENFPAMPRLSTIIAHKNPRLSSVHLNSFVPCVPHLSSLCCHHCGFKSLDDLKNLAFLASLERVSFIGCPVAELPDYRLFLIAYCPKLKLIDYNRVKLSEKEKAEEKFGREGYEWRKQGGTSKRRGRARGRPREDEETSSAPTGRAVHQARQPLSEKELLEKLEQASSLEEVERLEKELAQLSENPPTKVSRGE